MADLHEISMLLGEIRSDVKNANRWFIEHEKNDERRFQDLALRIDHANGFRGRIETLELHVESTKPMLENFRRIKWVAAGFVAAITLVGGAVGGLAATVLKWAL